MLSLGKLFNHNLQCINYVGPIFFFEIQEGQQTPVLFFDYGSALLAI